MDKLMIVIMLRSQSLIMPHKVMKAEMAVLIAALLAINALAIVFVNMFTGNHAITTNGIATMSLSIHIKNVPARFHNTTKSSVAVMFHNTTAKHAADMSLTTTTHAAASTVQSILVSDAANMFQDTTTNGLTVTQPETAKLQLVSNQTFVCQTGGACLPVCLPFLRGLPNHQCDLDFII